MKILGYWATTEDPELPDPRDLVHPDWFGADREHLLRYLRSAPMLRGTWGHSACRFQCGVGDSEMGSREHTDGEWVWPEGLAHYVDRHDVILPDEFVATCRHRNWEPDAGCVPRAREVDESFWRAWTAKTTKANKAVEDDPLQRLC